MSATFSDVAALALQQRNYGEPEPGGCVAPERMALCLGYAREGLRTAARFAVWGDEGAPDAGALRADTAFADDADWLAGCLADYVTYRLLGNGPPEQQRRADWYLKRFYQALRARIPCADSYNTTLGQ